MSQRESRDTRALFLQAAQQFNQGRYADALPLLVRAVEGGDAEAQNLLGVMSLNGMGQAADPRRAVELFSAAAGAGLKEGHYNLSNVLYNGLGGRQDATGAQEHLLAAARAGHRPALRSLGYLYHLMGEAGSWQELSTRCFRRAAEAGDPISKYNLGVRLNEGRGTSVDKEGAATWLTAAARDRVYLAQQRLAELGAQARGSAFATAGSPGELELPSFELPTTVARASRQVQFMSEYPEALDAHLCDHLINIAAPSLAPSSVVDPYTGQGLRTEVRTSYSMSFVASMYDPVVAEAMRRLASIGGLPASHGEPLGVLRYGLGQEYKPHFDYYNDDQHEAQRISTVFVYLSDVAEGGGTEFPRLGATVQPKRGKAVKFLNCDATGKPNPETLHAGLPVIRGEKWLATLWLWDRPFLWFA
jgi:TPR repeat protein